MKYTYSVGEKDFLNFQLYQLSKSESFTSKLNKQRFVVALISLALAIYFFVDKHFFLVVGFILIGLVWYFVYPIRTKRIYKNRFESEIKEKFQAHFNVPATFEILENSLKTSDKQGVSEKKFQDIKEIAFTESATYITFRNNQAFILSKELTEKYDEMVTELKSKAETNNLLTTNDLDWKW